MQLNRSLTLKGNHTFKHGRTRWALRERLWLYIVAYFWLVVAYATPHVARFLYWYNDAQTWDARWKIDNSLRVNYIKGTIGYWFAQTFGDRLRGLGLIVVRSEWHGVYYNSREDKLYDLGVVSRHVVTNAGVAAIVDGLDSLTMANFNFHGVGTGTGAEAASETGLVTESTTILTVDSTRATGTKSQPSANIYQTLGHVTFDGSGSIIETAVFSQAATGGGIMLDRGVHGVVAVVSGDYIDYTYQLTLPAGG